MILVGALLLAVFVLSPPWSYAVVVGAAAVELAAIPNFGKKSIEEVKETLQTHGLNLRGDE